MERYDRSEEVDLAVTHDFISSSLLASSSPPPLADNESKLLQEWLDFDTRNDFLDQFERIKGSLTSHPTVSLFQKKSTTNDEITWGKVSGNVDASAEVVLSWFWHFMSYERVRGFFNEDGYMPRSERNIPNSRSKIVATAKRFPGEERILTLKLAPQNRSLS